MLAGGKLKRVSLKELENVPFRNLFVSGSEVDITEILYNYFKAIEKKWPISWREKDKVGNLLPRSNAFKALMIFLRENVYPELVGEDFGRIPTIEEFSSKLAAIQLADADFTTRNFSPGSGGQSMFLKMLRQQITLEQMLES